MLKHVFAVFVEPEVYAEARCDGLNGRFNSIKIKGPCKHRGKDDGEHPMPPHSEEGPQGRHLLDDHKDHAGKQHSQLVFLHERFQSIWLLFAPFRAVCILAAFVRTRHTAQSPMQPGHGKLQSTWPSLCIVSAVRMPHAASSWLALLCDIDTKPCNASNVSLSLTVCNELALEVVGCHC